MPDYNKFSFADAKGVVAANRIFQLENGETCDDLLKCSNLQDSSFMECSILGNDSVRENAIDCNRFCENLLFSRCTITGGNQACIVIKGGCKNIRFKECLLVRSKRSWTDILIDDWSDQSTKPSTGIDLLGTEMVGGSYVRVVFGRWKKPILGPNQRILWIPTIGLHAYNIFKGLWKLVAR